MNNEIKHLDNGDFEVVKDSLDERFDAIIKRLSEEDIEKLLMSMNAAVGVSGNGPTALGDGSEGVYLEMNFTDDELVTLEEVMAIEKEQRQKVWRASCIITMGEVDDENGYGSRYATEEEYQWAKEVLGVEEDGPIA